MPEESSEAFEPEKVTIWLFGCCSYEETWETGISGWGATDEASRRSGYVSVEDYDKLLEMYKKLNQEFAESQGYTI